MNCLTLSDVTVRRGARTVLYSVDATFAAGRLTAVIGPNGAGKSTLLEAAAGLLVPAGGAITFGGVALTGIKRRTLARRRAYLPQSPGVDWPISVERVVALGLTAHLPAFGGMPISAQSMIDAALERHDLLDLRDRAATQLSGGELARVMLARATVGEPELLIVDEPTTGLDPRHAIDAGRQLSAIADRGCAVVVALHDLDLALRIADDIVALKDGRVFSSGPTDAMLTASTLGALYEVGVTVLRDGANSAIRFTA